MGSAKGGVLAIRAGNTLEENLKELLKHFPVGEDGYFGVKGTGRYNYIRDYFTDNPAKTAFEFQAYLSQNPSVMRVIPGKGFQWTMRDGGVVVYRRISSSKDHSPVVEMSCVGLPGVKDQKIHFVPKRKGD